MARPAQSIETFEAKRAEVINAATKVLESDGSVEGITLRSIAKILNWSYSTAYRYFASKEELLVALRIRAYKWMEEELSDAIRPHQPNTNSPNAENLERLTHAYISAGLRRPSVYKLMFTKVNLDEKDSELVKELNRAKRECLNVCTLTMINSQEAGEVSNSIDPLTAAHIFWVSAHGTVSLQLADQLVMGRSLQDVTHTLLNVVLSGLQSSTNSNRYFQDNPLQDHPNINAALSQ